MPSTVKPAIGACFHRTFPAAFVVEVAETLERADVDDLWIIEDCFFTAGISLAATALARTERLNVGLGILPAVARNPAITAMEFATLAALAPGRVVGGIGHGVQDWMQQMGARAPSPLSALEEVITVVRRLLRGEEVTFQGAHVHFDRVRLEAPPAVVPPVLAGVRQVKSLALAGRCADGVVLGEGSGPLAVGTAIRSAAAPGPFTCTVFVALSVDADRDTARARIAPFIASLIADGVPSLRMLPFWDDLKQVHDRDGFGGLISMPQEWWAEFGAIGTLDDAVVHVAALAAAGADRVTMFPAPMVEIARPNLTTIAEISAALR
jgi:5,10-methylenetetrahydromethanopterin reductase